MTTFAVRDSVDLDWTNELQIFIEFCNFYSLSVLLVDVPFRSLPNFIHTCQLHIALIDVTEIICWFRSLVLLPYKIDSF